MEGELILVLGGARSGKSRFAAELAKQRGGKAAFIATATAEDEEMRQRIEKHRCCRPKEWVTIEEPKQVTKWLREQGTDYDAIIMDCLTLLLSNWLFEGVDDETILGEVQKLAEQAKALPGMTILVSNEVGMGIVPENSLSRRFRDLAGLANQEIARQADAVYWMCAGIPVKIK